MANTSVRIDTVGLGIAWSLGETYRVAIDEGFVNQEGNSKMPIASNTSIISFSTPANPPQIGNTIPTHTSTAPINITDISFTIDRSAGNITILGGNVFLNRQGSPNIVVKTFAVSNASVTGNTVAFSVIGNLEASQTYFITSNANIFLDRDGFKNNAITNSSSYRFVSPTAPIVNEYNPGPLANKNFTNISMSFDRTIFSNSGNLFLHNANTNAVIRTYNISSALISNNRVTLDVVGNIDANGYYYVKSNANVVMDVTQIKYPGLTNTTTFAFQAPISPYLESTVPTRATTSASRSLTTVSFTLDRMVTAVSGNVYLYKQASPNVLLKTWTIGSNVTFNSDRTFTVTVPQGMLAPTQAHYISTDANIAKDLTYINFPGISTTGNTFTFTTDVAPLLSTTFPSYGTALDENESNISFTMDRVVTKNVGNVYLYKIDTVNGNSLVKTYDINANTYLIGNDTVNLPITSLLRVMESYYVNSDFDILKDYYTNEKYQGIIDANTFVFTTAVDRSYVVDRTAVLFPNNIPQITETDTGATYIVSLQLSTAIGQIQSSTDDFASPTGWTAGTRTYSVTGTKTTVNSALSNLYFFPFANTSSSATLTYSLTKNSVFQKSLVFAITSSANPGYLTGGGSTYTIAEDSKFNFMPFYVYPSWNSNCAVMLKSVQSGNVAVDAGKFYANTASGWTNANDGVIYKEFSRPANLVVYNSQVAEVRDIYYWLASDYTTSFSIDALLGIESSRSGNTLTGGTVYSVTNTYNITPGGEYSLLTSGSIAEDGFAAITLSITDNDVHPNITYNVQMQQISPDPGLIAGAFTGPGVGTRSYGSISDTQVKSVWNQVEYYAPADYPDSILIGATITKIQTGQANVILASNVAINLTNNATHDEYSFNNATYADNSWSYLNYSITDEDTNSPTYYVTITQISPDPMTTPANIIVSDIDYGTTWSVSGSRSTISNAVKRFYQFPDYTGNIVFGLTQIKSSYNGNITQAANVTATYTNNLNTAKYSLSDGTYIEDTNKNIDFTITDPDTRFNNYYINVQQISPDPSANVANIILGSSYGTNVTIYGSRTTINNLTKSFTPPGDWTSNIVLGYTQIKSTIFGNIIQAANVAVTYTNRVALREYALPIISSNLYSNVSQTLTGVSSVEGNPQFAIIGGGANNSNVITNLGNTSVTITNYEVAYSTAQQKFSTSSLWFNGERRLTLAANSVFNPNQDFTWEMWVYPAPEVNSSAYLISHYDLSDDPGFSVTEGLFVEFGFNQGNGPNNAWNAATNNGATYIGPANNVWSHIAVTRSGNNVRVFKNGALLYTYTLAVASYPTNRAIDIGGRLPQPGYQLIPGWQYQGYIEQIAYTRGVAKYTASFTPPEITVIPASFTITDLAANKQYQTIFSVDDNLANIYEGSTLRGNTYTITGNRASVNSVMAALSIKPGYYPSVETFNLNYTQTQTTDGVPQASVQVPFTVYPRPQAPIIGTVVQASNILVGSGDNISGNLSAILSWTAPPLTDTPVLYYTAVARSYGGNNFEPNVLLTTSFQSNSGNMLITNFYPGLGYQFGITATNEYGTSEYSSNSNTITIFSNPGGPYMRYANAINNSSAAVSFQGPPGGNQFGGGVPIQSFTAVSNPGNISATSIDNASPIIVTGLSANTAYTFTVYASHQYGNSDPSPASNTITTYISNLPSQPTNVTAISTSSSSSINVHWTAPNYTGGGITGYTITANTGNTITVGNVISTVFGNLSNTQPYTFTIYASNPYGNSNVSSASNPATPGIVSNTSGFFSNTSATTISSTLNNLPWPGDFTWEAWIYNLDTSNTQRGIFDLRNGGDSTTGVALRQNSSNEYLVIWSKSFTLFTSSGRINNQWQHIALVRNSGNVKLYFDGVASAQVGVDTRQLSDQTFRISGFNDDQNTNNTFRGYMDNVQFSNIARYTGNFTPSTSFNIDGNTLIALSFSGTNGSSTIVDGSYNANPIVNSGVIISTAQHK